MSDSTYRFDENYQEEAVLKDGQKVLIRLVRPADKQLLLQGLAKLSAEARYFRFMGARSDLSEGDLRYLTELDGTNHFALGALVKARDGTSPGVGVARFIRLQDNPETAEPAVTVLDAYQGKGLGRILLERLTWAARERGIMKFRCDILASNDRIQALLAPMAADAVVQAAEGVVTMEFELPEPTLGERVLEVMRESELYRAFAQVAQGLLPSRFGHHLSSSRLHQTNGEAAKDKDKDKDKD